MLIRADTTRHVQVCAIHAIQSITYCGAGHPGVTPDHLVRHAWSQSMLLGRFGCVRVELCPMECGIFCVCIALLNGFVRCARLQLAVAVGARASEMRGTDPTWFKVLWESPESASYHGAFRALKASFRKAEKRAPNLLGPRLELLSRGHRPVESGNQTSQNPPDHLV